MCFAALTQSQDDMEGSLGASSFATLTFHLYCSGQKSIPLPLKLDVRTPKSQRQPPVALQLSKVTIRKHQNTSLGQTKIRQGDFSRKILVKQSQTLLVGPLPKYSCRTEQDCSGDLGETRCFPIPASDTDVMLTFRTRESSFAEISVPRVGY